jgi:hypothetical protein
MARRSATSILLLLTKRGRSAKETLVAIGVLNTLSMELLLDLPSLVCDPSLIKTALSTISLLLEHSSIYRQHSLEALDPSSETDDHQPLIADVLEPMLRFHLLLLAISQGEYNVNGDRQQSLALIIRSIHAASSGCDVGKEAIRSSGAIRSLIHFIISHSPMTPTLDPLSMAHNEVLRVGGKPSGSLSPLTRLSVVLLLRTTPFQSPSLGHFMAFLLPLILIMGEREREEELSAPPARLSQSGPSVQAEGLREGSIALDLLPQLSASPSSPLLLESKPLCPIREAVAALKAILSDNTRCQAEAIEEGIVPAMAHLLATGDTALSTLVAEVICVLASAGGGNADCSLSPESSSLVAEVPWHIVACGIVESLTSVLAESPMSCIW